MSRDRLDMTGLWHGAFAYPSYQGPTTAFVARIGDDHGLLSGTIMEPNTMGRSSDELQALVNGNRNGQEVDFTKTYDGASDAAHSVDYVGRLSGDGRTVRGVWSMEGLDGTFEMHRDAVWEELEGKEAEVANVEPEAIGLNHSLIPASLDMNGSRYML